MILLSGLIAGIAVFLMGFTNDFLRKYVKLSLGWKDGKGFIKSPYHLAANKEVTFRRKLLITWLSMRGES
jgi:hypothetical protein